MNAQEFKTWFEGFAEAITGAPTEAQWKTVKKQAAAVTDTPIQVGGPWWKYPTPQHTPTCTPIVTSTHISAGDAPITWVSRDPPNRTMKHYG